MEAGALHLGTQIEGKGSGVGRWAAFGAVLRLLCGPDVTPGGQESGAGEENPQSCREALLHGRIVNAHPRARQGIGTKIDGGADRHRDKKVLAANAASRLWEEADRKRCIVSVAVAP